MTPIEQLKAKIAELQAELLSQNPKLPFLLREIHSQLKEDQAVVTLLSDEEIGILVSGLKKQTNTDIATSAPKKAASVTKQIKGKSENDLLGML